MNEKSKDRRRDVEREKERRNEMRTGIESHVGSEGETNAGITFLDSANSS